MKNGWRADPLVWGHGPRIFEVFLEPTCPYSVKAFGKLDDLLDQAGEDHITVKIRLQSQPWHMYSGIIVRIESYSGVKLEEAFAIPDLDREIKWHCRYARQNGIHVSPTFMIDGLVQADMSSGDTVSDWVSRLLKT